jgi:hypothetical protein
MKRITLMPLFLFLVSQITIAQIVNEGNIPHTNKFNLFDIIPNSNDNQNQFKSNQKAEIYLKDSTLFYNWDAVNNTWLNPESRIIYNYNNQGSLIYSKYSSRKTGSDKWRDIYETDIIRDLNDLPIVYHQNKFDTITGNWIPNRYDTVTYKNNKANLSISSIYNKLYNQWHRIAYYRSNDDGYLLESYDLSWDYQSNQITSGVWETWVLNSQNKEIELILKLYNSSSSDWSNYYKQTLTYQNDSILTGYFTYEWINSDQSWKLKSQSILSYSNNLLTDKIKQLWDGLIWNNSERIVYEYNSDNKLVKTVNQFWNNSDWHDSSREILSYDNYNNVSEWLTQVFSNNVWVNITLFGRTYNANNQIIELLSKYWDSSTGQLTSGSSRTTYLYNNNELNTEIIYQKWDPSIIDWVNSNKDINYYSTHHTSGIISLTNEDIILFPNPANNTLSFSGLSGDSEISIYNMAGILVLNKLIDSEQIDISDLKKGVYILKITNPVGTVSKQFLKQ